MARRTLLGIPGVPQHVNQRGDDRCACFVQEGDYARYLRGSATRLCATIDAIEYRAPRVTAHGAYFGLG